MKSPRGDELERRPCLVETRRICSAQQRGQVHAVVRTCAVVSGEDFQCNEMAEPSDRHTEAQYGLDGLRRRHDLRLDPGRREEQVNDRAPDVVAREREPDGGQTSRGVLLDRRNDAPIAPLEVTDERLGVPIIGNEHGEVGVAGEPGLGAGRDREAADQ